MENTVDMMQLGSVPDDAAQAQEENLDSLSDIAQQPSTQTPPEEPAPKSEPGWIKKRVNAAVEKAVAEAEARVAARYEAELAPLRESMMDREAQELFQAGEFKSLDRAKEYVRLKNGARPVVPSAATGQPPARDAQGRFVKNDAAPSGGEDPTTKAKADLLAHQAQRITAQRGIDVVSAFNNDPDIQKRVLSGEWDFYDVADHMAAAQKRVPAPMRNPNGAGTKAALTVASMSDEQFETLNANLASGRKYDMR